MKKIFEITNENLINSILDEAEYGTLALCVDNKPYSLPINFVRINQEIYFHGAKKGKKMGMIKDNSYGSFSVVEALSLIPSYFSNTEGSACPASQMFKSIIIDGKFNIIEDYTQKMNALEALMKKLQKEGKYIPLSDNIYEKSINATALFKLVPTKITGKLKVGQHLDEKRYKMIIESLIKRGTKKDLETLKLMKKSKTILV